MINMEADDYGLHLIRKGEEKTHAKVRPEFPETQGCVRIFFFYDFGTVQGKLILGKCS